MLRSARRTLVLIVVLTMPSLLSGCWDYHEVHLITYGSTIGIDYVNQEYKVYVQSMNMANIAQLQAPRPPRHRAVVGIARGETVAEAMFNLYRSEQQHIYWGHIAALVFSRKVLEQTRIESLVDSINRFHDLRYNVWVYGTDEPVFQLLNSSPFLGRSPFDSRLMKANQLFRQYSSMQPIYLNRFITDYFERGKTLLLPRLSLDRSTWTEGGEKVSMFKMDGYYVFAAKRYAGMLTEDQMKGRRYMNRRSVRMPVTIFQNGKPAALVALYKPLYRVRYSVTGGQVSFDVGIRIRGYIDELLQDISRQEVEREVCELVKDEVRETFDNGKKLNADTLNLTTYLFRYHYPTWRRTVTDHPDMRNVTLRGIRVRFTLTHSGKYKDRLS